MSFAYCSADLRAFLLRYKRVFMNMISKILRRKSKEAKDEKYFFEMNV